MQCEEDIKKNQEKAQKIKTYRRFDNLGNTCYMGSILHILQQIPIFADYFFDAAQRRLCHVRIGGDRQPPCPLGRTGRGR